LAASSSSDSESAADADAAAEDDGDGDGDGELPAAAAAAAAAMAPGRVGVLPAARASSSGPRLFDAGPARSSVDDGGEHSPRLPLRRQRIRLASPPVLFPAPAEEEAAAAAAAGGSPAPELLIEPPALELEPEPEMGGAAAAAAAASGKSMGAGVTPVLGPQGKEDEELPTEVVGGADTEPTTVAAQLLPSRLRGRSRRHSATRWAQSSSRVPPDDGTGAEDSEEEEQEALLPAAAAAAGVAAAGPGRYRTAEPEPEREPAVGALSVSAVSVKGRRRNKRDSLAEVAWGDGCWREEEEDDVLLRQAEEEAREENCRQMFASIDEDGSGEIDKAELAVLCKKLGRKLNPRELDEAMREMDTDGSGSVDYEEFRAWFNSLLQQDQKTNDWKKSVADFYRTSTAQASGEGFAQTKVNALGFIAKTSVRNRLEKQRQLEAQEEERAQRQKQAQSEWRQRHETRESRRQAGEEVDSEEEEQEFAEEEMDLRPVGADQEKEWGRATAVMRGSQPEYPRREGAPVCVRYLRTGRCKFIDEGHSCSFDHPPPTSEEARQAAFLQKRGLRVVKGWWGNFTRKGQPVPGKCVDVTGALQAMVVEQGGLQLELPREGKEQLPGFGDPCPGLKRELRVQIIRSGGGKRVSKKRYKDTANVMILTRRKSRSNCIKACCCFSCPCLWLLVGILFTLRWMWGTMQDGCATADFSECSVDDGTFPVPIKDPCVVPYNFSSENIERIEVELQRGNVNVLVNETLGNNVVIEVQHIAKSNKAIIGMSSTATSEEGVIKVVNSWNDSHSEDAEAGPLHALNCFRAEVNITVPPDMAYLRPSLKVNVTGLPNVCGVWNPMGCYEWWPTIKYWLNLDDPYIMRYGSVFIHSRPWKGLGNDGFQWTAVDVYTNGGKIETYDVETYVGPDAVLTYVADAPPDGPPLGSTVGGETEERGDITINSTYAHQLRVRSKAGGLTTASNVQLCETEGARARLGLISINATGKGSVKMERIRHGDMEASTAEGGITVRLGPAYFKGRYELRGGFDVSVDNAAHVMEPAQAAVRGSSGFVGVGGRQQLEAESARCAHNRHQRLNCSAWLKLAHQMVCVDPVC
jgi:hypothetical protein